MLIIRENVGFGVFSQWDESRSKPSLIWAQPRDVLCVE